MNIEKTAIKSTFFRRALTHYRKGGAKGAVDYLRKFRDPTHALPLGKKNVPKKIYTDPKQKGKANLSRGVRTSMGNMAENMHILTKDIKGKGILGGTGQAAKNTGELLARQVKGDTVKEIKGPYVLKGNKKYIKSKNPLLKDREVISQTGRDTFLIKKRAPMQPIGAAVGVSAASVGGLSYALSDKEKPKSKRLQTAAKDTAMFLPGIPIGIAGTMAFGSGSEQRKKKKETKIN